jgi:hypothetical protein
MGLKPAVLWQCIPDPMVLSHIEKHQLFIVIGKLVFLFLPESYKSMNLFA